VFVPQDILDQVGFLVVDLPVGKGVRKYEIGTCFFVTVENAARNIGFGYLVTARHVLEGLDGKQMYVRLNKYTIEHGKPGVKYLPLSNDWHFHPDDSVDLAVLPWAPRGDNYTCCSMSFDDIVTTPQFMTEHGGAWPPPPGEPVLYVGLLTQHAGVDRNFPIVRRGHLALVTNEKINGKYGLSDYHLIELQAYPGHSGGPVWVAIPTVTAATGQVSVTAFLLGTLVAGFPERQEVVVTPRTRRKAPQVAEYYNLGISLVTPVEKLKDILLSPLFQEKRQKDEPRPLRPIPVTTARPRG
jgi:hypothetical protein